MKRKSSKQSGNQTYLELKRNQFENQDQRLVSNYFKNAEEAVERADSALINTLYDQVSEVGLQATAYEREAEAMERLTSAVERKADALEREVAATERQVTAMERLVTLVELKKAGRTILAAATNAMNDVIKEISNGLINEGGTSDRGDISERGRMNKTNTKDDHIDEIIPSGVNEGKTDHETFMMGPATAHGVSGVNFTYDISNESAEHGSNMNIKWHEAILRLYPERYDENIESEEFNTTQNGYDLDKAVEGMDHTVYLTEESVTIDFTTTLK